MTVETEKKILFPRHAPGYAGHVKNTWLMGRMVRRTCAKKGCSFYSIQKSFFDSAHNGAIYQNRSLAYIKIEQNW